ncbi:MAG: CoA-binding protein [Candidatus Thorarchaeota archaeon]|nr:MAG: CoA-binding protein [Candidatus Thorarchaeota archaeon]
MNSSARLPISEMLDIKSVAIIGVSPRMGYYWTHSMVQWPHDLKIWLVSKSGGEAFGRQIYTSASEIPEDFDYAIVAVPYRFVPEVLRQCAEKGAKGATVFTSGFSELGSNEGKERETELGELVHSVPTRVFGPNCMGLMYPKIGMAFMPAVKQLIGNVGFISQSGGVAITVYTACVESGVGFSKVFSFGNAIDITPTELLDYFTTDEETEAVGIYIEGTKDGRELLRAMREVAEKKPVVVVKGGRSQEGSRAVSSHTGALAGSNEVWDAAFQQANVVMVDTLEALVATLGILSKCPPPQSRRVGIIAISGGTSVVYTDLCVESGLEVPNSSPETVTHLRSIMHSVGNAVGNPIDLAIDYYQESVMTDVIATAGSDPAFDSLILQADVHNIHQAASIMDAAEEVEYLWGIMAKAGREVMDSEKKPVLIAIPEVAYPEARMRAWKKFVEAGLPVFRNVSEAVGALAKACEYYETRRVREA